MIDTLANSFSTALRNMEETNQLAQSAIEEARGERGLQSWGELEFDNLRFLDEEDRGEVVSTLAFFDFPQPFPSSMPVRVILINVQMPNSVVSVQVESARADGFEVRFTGEASIFNALAEAPEEFKIEWAAFASILQ